MSRRRIAWGFAAGVYDKLLIAGVQLVMVPVLVLHWGLHLYGCWVLLATIPGFLAIADLGFGGAAFVRMTGLVARGERDAAVVVLQTACQVVAMASAVLLSVALLAIWAAPVGWLPHDPALNDGGTRWALVLLVCYAITIFQGSLQGASYASVQLFPLFAFTNAHIFLLENLLLAGAVATGHGPLAGAAALLIGRAGGTVGQALLLRRHAPWLRYGFARADATERRVLGRSALGVLAVPLAQATALQGSVLALGAVAGPAAVPAFAAARTLSRIGLQATMLLTHAVLPDFTAAHAREDQQQQATMLVAVVGAAMAAALPFALMLGLTGQWVVKLWTSGAVSAPPGLMPVFAVSVLLAGLWTPLSGMMYAINRQGAFVWAYLLLGIASVAITLALGSVAGATGAALALVGLDAGMCLVVGRFARAHWWRGLPTVAVARALIGRGRAVFRQ